MGQNLSSPPPKRRHPSFVSFGMIVLDELHFASKTTLYDVPGGSGLFSTLGARLMDPSVGAIILAGKDFPDSLMERIMQWDIKLLVQKLPHNPCTRGFVQYKDDESCERTFRYLTPQLQPQPFHLQGSDLIRSDSYHFLADPDLLHEMVTFLFTLRRDAKEDREPLIVWEPAPLSCKKDLLSQHIQASTLVDVFSPNHTELGALVGDGELGQPSTFSRKSVERGARQFLHKSTVVVVRCGEHGCLTLSQSLGTQWLPPFYESTSPRIADTTGAGNAFLGGFAAGWSQTGDLREAAISGSVAASFAIEQIGLPEFSPATSTAEETWNGVQVSTRVAEYRRKLSAVENGLPQTQAAT